MNLQELELYFTHNVKSIVFDPAFYADRPANLKDLNAEKLEQIYQGILRHAGPWPANEFVKMVAKLDDMAPGRFMARLIQLCEEHWMYPDDFTEDSVEVIDPEERRRIVYETYHKKRVESDRYISDQIRMPFLRSHLSDKELGKFFPPLFAGKN